MFVLFPLVCFCLLFILSQRAPRKVAPSGRESFLEASLAWATLVVISTELLSLFRHISFNSILGFWIIISFVTLVIARRYPATKCPSLVLNPFSSSELIMLCGICFILLAVGLTAIMAPPNNWDSMVYHMSRVSHWIQNRSIANYPADDLRQLTYPPWAEFTIMHFQLLSGTDRLANLIQWFAMLGSIIGVSLLAKQFGANRKEQIFAALIAVTIPIGILEGSNTKNDYVVSFWIVCAVYFLNILRHQPDLKNTLLAAVSLALAFFTKVTAYIFLFPFVIWFIIAEFKKSRWRLWRPFACIGAVVLAVNGAFFMRNINLCGNFIGSSKIIDENANGILTAASFLSNVIRNISLHLALPFKSVDTLLEKFIIWMHTLLKINIADTRTTYEGIQLQLGGHTFHEDFAGNLCHLILIVVCTVFFFLMKKQFRPREAATHSFLILTAFVLFNLCLKWNPWNSRYQLPLFVLCSPFLSLVLSRTTKRSATAIISPLLILCALPWVFYNQTRGILRSKNILNTPRIEQYFSASPGFQYSYVEAVKALKTRGCFEVGLSLKQYHWEYPLWVLFKNQNGRPLRLEHVNVRNTSSAYLREDFKPCAIIDDTMEENNELAYAGSIYRQEEKFPLLKLFIKKE